MPSMLEIIRQIQRDLSCPVCGKNYEIDKIRLKGLFDHTLIIQTVCSNNHLTLFITTVKVQKQKSISTNEVIDLHKDLENFNGDFKKVWSV